MPSTTIVLITSLLAPLALTAPSPALKRQDSQMVAITLVASHSTSPIHLQPIAATNETFYIGKNTTSSCPEKEVVACPAGNVTSIIVDGDDGASMNAETPGGQIVYVLPTGALAFTPAHAEGEVSVDNGTTNGFSYTNGTDGFPGHFNFQGWSWFACPVEGAKEGTGPWQVFADVPGSDVSGCINFDALGEPYSNTGAAAWEYE